MAYAFLRILVQTRTKGHSAVGAVCYRFGLAAQSSFVGEDGLPRRFDYTDRTAIMQTGYALPAGASDAWRDPLEWAHRVEAADKRKNSRQCRDDVIGLPIELVEAGTHLAAVQAYAEQLSNEHHTPTHFVIHQPERGGKNWHAHVVYAGRRIDPEDGDRFAARRDRAQDLADRKDKDGNVIERRGIHHRHREIWTEVCRSHGLELDWTPNETPQIHIGPQACAFERRQIAKEASECMARAIADTGETPPDPRTLRECAELAHGISDGLTVREMLDLDRDPVHPRAIMSPKTPPPARPRLGPPAPPQVAPALRLDPPPRPEHVPGIRLGPPPPPFRHPVRLPQPIHLRPEIRETPQRIREVVRTRLESAGAGSIESRMGNAAVIGGFHWIDFGVSYGRETVRAANRALDEEVAPFVPREESQQTVIAHLEDWHRKIAKAVRRWKAHARRRHDEIVGRIVAAVLPTARAEAIDRIRQREAELRSARPMRPQPNPAPAPARRERSSQVAPQRGPKRSRSWDPWD